MEFSRISEGGALFRGALKATCVGGSTNAILVAGSSGDGA